MIQEIQSNKVFYIKLGLGGSWASECIKNNTLKLGYNEIDHTACVEKNWDIVRDWYVNNNFARSASNHIQQIQKFYEADKHTLWITFHADKLWWCFSKPSISLETDKTKTRPVIGNWSDKDIKGNTLHMDLISGNLLKTHAFRGTICTIDIDQYVLNKINGKEEPEVIDMLDAYNSLKNKISALIKKLSPNDFEILIDLIFRHHGWQRQSVLGKTLKTKDLSVFHPLLQERWMIQIKSEFIQKDLLKYIGAIDDSRNEYHKFIFITHSPKQEIELDDEMVDVWFEDKIANAVVDSGLVSWLESKQYWDHHAQ